MKKLQDIEPKTWRRVDVPLSSTLMALHDIILLVMGWRSEHIFEFHIGEKIYGEPMPDDAIYERKIFQAKSLRLQTLVERI